MLGENWSRARKRGLQTWFVQPWLPVAVVDADADRVDDELAFADREPAARLGNRARAEQGGALARWAGGAPRHARGVERGDARRIGRGARVRPARGHGDPRSARVVDDRRPPVRAPQRRARRRNARTPFLPVRVEHLHPPRRRERGHPADDEHAVAFDRDAVVHAVLAQTDRQVRGPARDAGPRGSGAPVDPGSVEADEPLRPRVLPLDGVDRAVGDAGADRRLRAAPERGQRGDVVGRDHALGRAPAGPRGVVAELAPRASGRNEGHGDAEHAETPDPPTAHVPAPASRRPVAPATWRESRSAVAGESRGRSGAPILHQPGEVNRLGPARGSSRRRERHRRERRAVGGVRRSRPPALYRKPD